jgi:L-alanine-DL-glutamate epimerase-like enolase superfamily enzyme
VVRIVDVREQTHPVSSSIRNAYIDFSRMTLSLVAVVTDVVRDGRPVVGYGFNSNGRYGQGAMLRERFIPRLLEADPASLVSEDGTNLDPHAVWSAMMTNEKPGGHGERSVAVGTVDMAVWDAVAKIEDKPLFQLVAERYGSGEPDRRVFVYAAGGYYTPAEDREAGLRALEQELLDYTRRGYTVVKMKIGGAPLEEDVLRIERVLDVLEPGHRLAVDANGRFDTETALRYAEALSAYDLFWYEEPGDPLDYALQAEVAGAYAGPLATGRTSSPRRTPATSCATAGCARTATGCSSTARSATGWWSTCAPSTRCARPAGRRRGASPRRTPDVPQHRRRTRAGRQRVLPRPLPALRGLPRRGRGRGRRHHDAGPARHRLRGQGRPARPHARPGRLSRHRPACSPGRRAGRRAECSGGPPLLGRP